VLRPGGIPAYQPVSFTERSSVAIERSIADRLATRDRAGPDRQRGTSAHAGVRGQTGPGFRRQCRDRWFPVIVTRVRALPLSGSNSKTVMVHPRSGWPVLSLDDDAPAVVLQATATTGRSGGVGWLRS
jgi:hypothetical protein